MVDSFVEVLVLVRVLGVVVPLTGSDNSSWRSLDEGNMVDSLVEILVFVGVLKIVVPFVESDSSWRSFDEGNMVLGLKLFRNVFYKILARLKLLVKSFFE